MYGSRVLHSTAIVSAPVSAAGEKTRSLFAWLRHHILAPTAQGRRVKKRRALVIPSDDDLARLGHGPSEIRDLRAMHARDS
jgi:hypothetical protein